MGEGSALGTYEPGTRQEETALRGYLSGFGLNAYKAVIPVKHLSGGQRMRVAMVRNSVRYICIFSGMIHVFITRMFTCIGGCSCT